MSRWVAVVWAAALLGCDGTPAGVDAGSGVDAGTLDDAGSGAAPFTYAVAVHELQDDGSLGAPVAGAHVVVDTDQGRFAAVTGADGAARVDAEAGDGSYDLLIAASGFIVHGEMGRAVAAIGAEAERMDLPRLAPTDAPIVVIRGVASGVPAGGRWCLAAAPFYLQCSGAMAFDVSLSEALMTGSYVAFAIDADGAVVEVVTGDITPAGAVTRVDVTFDGASELALTSREVRVELPADPASPFADLTMLPEYWGWFSAFEPGTHLARGLVTNAAPATDGHALTATFWEAMGPDETLLYAGGAYPGRHEGGSVRVFRWYATEPTGELSFLDVPRPLSEGEPLDATIHWTPVVGAERYAVVVEVGDALVMRVLTSSADGLRMPALPDGFDASGVYPPGDAWAVMRVVALAGTPPPNSGPGDPYAVDAQIARGPAFSLMR